MVIEESDSRDGSEACNATTRQGRLPEGIVETSKSLVLELLELRG